MKIIWSPTSLRHFASWIGFIAKDSTSAAMNERTKILKTVKKLEKFPQSGRIVPEFGSPALREVIKKPIRIIYRIKGGKIEILTLHHSRRELNAELFL